MAGDFCNFLHGLKPAMAMVLTQIIFAGLNVLYKLAIRDGMSLPILVAYRYIFATIFLAPFAFFVERNSRPKLTWMVTFQAFLCGLFAGALNQNLYLSCLTLTSATFLVAMTNLISAITYIMAVTLRMERMGIRTLAGKAKLAGTAIGIGGAIVLTFYKGPEINIWSTKVDLIGEVKSRASRSASHVQSSNHILGSLLAIGCCFFYALTLIIQTKMSEKYPCYLSSTTLICMMGSIQGAIYALCVERKWEQWKLGWNIRLWTVAYSVWDSKTTNAICLLVLSFKVILATGLLFTVVAWGVRVRGPVFVSVFNPLGLVVVAIMGSLLLDEKLHVGSVIGSALIVVGLYAVLWGKGKEMKMMSQLMPSKSFREAEHIEVVVTTIPSSSPATTETSTINNLNTEFSNDAPHNLATVASAVLAATTIEEEEEDDDVVCGWVKDSINHH